MRIISVRENPQDKDLFIQYFQRTWASENTMMVYEDCISHSIEGENLLPQWYLLIDDKHSRLRRINNQ